MSNEKSSWILFLIQKGLLSLLSQTCLFFCSYSVGVHVSLCVCATVSRCQGYPNTTSLRQCLRQTYVISSHSSLHPLTYLPFIFSTETNYVCVCVRVCVCVCVFVWDLLAMTGTDFFWWWFYSDDAI